jgi:anti-sigma factor RsiW
VIERNELRQYILGQLTEPARDALEERLFVDTELLEQAEACESELMAQYVAGALDQAERAQWERYLSAHPQSTMSLERERALQHRFAPKPNPAREWSWAWARWLVPVAALLILLAILMPRPRPRVTSTPIILAIALQPGALRGSAELPQFVTLPATVERLRLHLPSAGGRRVRIRFVDSNAIVLEGPLRDGAVELDAKLLQIGDHVATVLDEGGEEQADFIFRVHRIP